MSFKLRIIELIAFTALAVLSQGVLAIGPLPTINFEERKSDQVSRGVLEDCVFGPVCDLPVVNVVESVQLRTHPTPTTVDHNPSDLSNFEYIIDSGKLTAADELDIQINIVDKSYYYTRTGFHSLQDCDVLFEEFRYLHPEIIYTTGHYCDGGTGGQGYIAPGASDIYYPVVNGVQMWRGIVHRHVKF